MGTRATTLILDYDSKPLVMLYRSHDGYPDGHGAELVRYLKGKVMINGIQMKHNNMPNFFNGIWELAPRLISNINGGKDSPGICLKIVGMDEDDRNYHYTIYIKQAEGTEGSFFDHPENTRIFLKCEVAGYKKAPSKVLFDCWVDKLDPDKMDQYETDEDE